MTGVLKNMMTKINHRSYLIQSARKRAHLCAILRPASKKHIRTMSVSRVLVFASRLALPSLKLKTIHKACFIKKYQNGIHMTSSFCFIAPYLQDPLEKTPASQHRISKMRLWACSVVGQPSLCRHRASSSFSWKSKNCSIANRWILRDRK